MSSNAMVLPATVGAESPGLWTLAWRRFRRDRVGMISLVVVLLFVALTLASAVGLIASDWAKEAGVSYAPPSFIGPESVSDRSPARDTSSDAALDDDTGIVDP
ncbi:MAG: hypothetical protein ACXWCW_28505, partial [Burkholderiales bacterium]